MPPNLFNTTCNIKRLVNLGRDSLNNPVYNNPSTWPVVYTNMPCKLAFSSKEIRFSMTGEHPDPAGIMYVPTGYTILPNDRVITSDAQPIEYVVVSVVPAYMVGTVVNHYEVILKLPT